MASPMRKCLNCKTYTLKEVCPNCGEKTQEVRLPKFSPNSKYSKYRRIGLLDEREKRGLL
jgi:H/ACA ribonucleoprotein complex subunit 3